jgi:ADP-ribose pyrophosphatase
MRRIESECADELTGAAMGKGGKRLGILLEDEVRLYVRDALRFPSGATRCQIRVIGKTEFDGPNGVAVLPMLDGKIVLREIFRHPTRAKELEITRGRRELGQTPRQAARAEVKQELGYRVKRLHRLGRVQPETALMSSIIDVFLAELSAAPRNDDPESSEALGRIVHLTPDVLGQRIASGRIRDSYTICALQLAQLRGLIPPITGGG